jgi:hypothetical protein
MGLSQPNSIKINVCWALILIRPTYTPGGYVAPQYGSRAQQMAVVDVSAPLTPEQKKTIKEIIGAFLYNA